MSPTGTAVAAFQVSKTYSGRSGPIEAVKNVTLGLTQGTITALLGPNGAGKTTLVKMMCGLLLPDSGRIELMGTNVATQRQKAIRNVGVVLEGTRNFYHYLTVTDNLRYFGLLCGLPSRELGTRIDHLLQLLDLGHKRREYGFSLSRGMQQKMALAIALLKDPALLLLDEPTLGLDIESSETLVAVLRQMAAQGRTILLTTHNMALAEELSERVIFLHDGRTVMDGALDELLRHGLKEAYLRVIGQARDDAARLGAQG